LLPAGIISVDGEFNRGYAVSVLRPDKEEIARGIARYNSRELSKIAGCQSAEISERLGYEYGPVVIHRNDLILM
jgi:glutamate 5-kinase